ncbi:hypothetical protein IU452_26090 [Nocardia transvalensis]|nr:hypothetical protein [Nocardia transvalensis]MBF6331980.1 hypothetical protein [Nocardia transvalensis]
MRHKLLWASVAACPILLSAQIMATPPAHAAPVDGQRVEQALNSAWPGVSTSWVRLYSPLPPEAGPRPPACDYVSYLRYRPSGGPRRSADTDAVVTVMPGVLSGPAQFDSLAAELVRRNYDRGRTVEFWGMQRRSGCYFDRAGLDAAIEAEDYRVAVDYYFHRKPVHGKTFAGWPTPEATRAMTAVDFAQQNRDWHTAIADAFPDRQQRSQKVFCGGHSLGATNLRYFAGTEFGRPDNPDPGFAQCAGFIVLDSTLTAPSLDPRARTASDDIGTGFANLVSTVGRQRAQAVSMPTADDIPLAGGALADIMTVFSIAAIGAYFQPDDESQLLRMLPHTPTLELIIRGLFAADHLHLITNNPDVRSFRYTNAAMLGALLDNNSMPVAAAQMSFGSLGGGPLREKYLFVPEELADTPFVGRPLPVIGEPLEKTLLGFGKVAPADPNALYTWNNYDHPAAPDLTGRVYSTPQSEHTDIRHLARQLFEGPAMFFDPFFPMAQLNSSIDVDYSDGPFRRPAVFVYGTAGTVNDTLEMLTPIGEFLSPGTPPLRPRDAAVGIGYTHLDVLTAAPHQNDGRPSATTTAVIDFIGTSTG